MPRPGWATDVLSLFLELAAQLADMLGEMFGELNVGHAYHMGGDVRRGKPVGTGMLAASMRTTSPKVSRRSLDVVLMREARNRSLAGRRPR